MRRHPIEELSMNSRLSVSLLLVLAVGFAAGIGTAGAQTVKVGVFDAQKITQDTAEGAKIQARLNSFKEKKGAELKKLQEDIENLQKDYTQQVMSASDDKKKELTLQIQRKQDELDSAQKAANRELQLEVEAAQEGWQRRVLEVVNAYGKEKGFTLIVPAEVAVFYSPEIDVTPDLIKLVDAQAAQQPAGARPGAVAAPPAGKPGTAPAPPPATPPAKPPVKK
jgi:outer membrane protein